MYSATVYPGNMGPLWILGDKPWWIWSNHDNENLFPFGVRSCGSGWVVLTLSWWMDVFFQTCIVSWGGTCPRSQQPQRQVGKSWVLVTPESRVISQKAEVRAKARTATWSAEEPGSGRPRMQADPAGWLRWEWGQEQVLHDRQVWLTWGHESLVGKQWDGGKSVRNCEGCMENPNF